MKKICFVTGTRAEYGLLKPVMSRLKENPNAEIQIVVTGSHLSPEFGLSYQEIEKDGFEINKKVEILLSSDSQIGVAKSMGLTMISFSEVFVDLSPDMVVVLGDRYEIFSATATAYTLGIPVAHISGGEVTEGALDDGFRHSITKMSRLHFTSNDCYRNRVIQLGESPETVFNVGDLGVENSVSLKKMSQKELSKSLGFDVRKPFFLFTYHPETMIGESAGKSIRSILEVLDLFPQYNIIFTKANADAAGREINQAIADYVDVNSDRAVLFESLGRLRYLSAMSYCRVVIGNSSSGIVEAPSLGVPTVNIGDRQKGRLMAKSIISCKVEKEAIFSAITEVIASNWDKERFENPYGDGQNVSQKIETQILSFLNQKITMNKPFYDMVEQNEK